MRTSAPEVFAAGDVASAFNTTAGRHITVEHWQDAVDQGEIAGAAAAGGTRNGMAYLGSGQRSATPRSSITRGATATTTLG